MSNSYVQAGSPLDDYFRDEVEELADEGPSLCTASEGSEPDEKTLVDHSNNMSKHSPTSHGGWSGNIPNVASSSRSSRRSSIRSSSALSDTDHRARPSTNGSEEFSERFKYLVCSSGLLEKDHVPCLGANLEDHEKSERKGQDQASGGYTDRDHPFPSLLIRLFTRQLEISHYIRRRPDIALAGAVLVVAVVWVVGWKIVALSGIAVGLAVLGALHYLCSKTPATLPRPALVPSYPSGPVTSTPQGQAMTALEDLLVASKTLDHTADAALLLLQETDDSSDDHRPLRVAVHRLTEGMTDHIATATSTLLEMADRKELGVLGDMYDIPVATSFFYPRAQRRALNGSSDSAEGSGSDEGLPPRRLSFNASSPLKPLSLPMSTSSSVPTRLNGRLRHATHQSLSGLTLDDRYTSLPPRTPRASKRSSWAPEWNDRIKHDIGRDRSSEQEGEQHLSPVPRRLPVQNNPKTPPIPVFTPRKSSPLSQSDSPVELETPQRHIFPIIPPTPAHSPLMPSPMVKSPIKTDVKRRSLQSMPYFRSDQSDLTSPGRASIAGTTSLSRTPSLQYSDLQMLRDQSTHGSRRSSVSAANVFAAPSVPLTAALSLPVERPRPRRGDSLNPLTTPGLKAACLGIHLKRRRMSCCLLGLKFDGDDEYWEAVKDVLGDLTSGIKRETAELEAALAVAKRIRSPGRTNISTPAPPPWAAQVNGFGNVRDFAPRTSDAALLAQHVETLEHALHQAWAKLQEVKRSITVPGELTSSWAAVRNDLGQLTREWERGKEVIARLDPPRIEASSEAAADDYDDRPPPLPPFMQAWEAGNIDTSVKGAAQSLEAGSDRDIGHDDQANGALADVEPLPPPGQDVVFESLPLPGDANGNERSKLSRAERIQLMKEARDKGMTLQEMLSRRNGDIGDNDNRRAKAMGGEVVGELKGMIGMIRRRKGLDEYVDTAAKDEVEVSSHVTPTRILPPPGLADELKRAFVFPAGKVNGHVSH